MTNTPDIEYEAHAERRSNGKPPVLIVGNLLSKSTGIRFTSEELSKGLRVRGWPVISTSAVQNRGMRAADMLATVWLRRARYAVAQVNAYSGAAFLWAEAVGASLKALSCPYVVTLHSGAFPDFAERWPSRMRRLLESATVVTSPSPFLKKHFASWRPDIRLMPNGLSLGEYPYREITKANPRLVWVRAYERRYNPVLALQVVERLSPEFPEVELLMVGPDTEDWSAEQTRAEARRLGVDGQVQVRGPVPKAEVSSALQQGDIFLNTTNVDNAPVTVVEAMACGLCVVSTDAGGVPDLVADGEDALLVPQADPEAMAAAIRRILIEPATAAKLSRNGRLNAETHDWDRIFPKWEELLTAIHNTGRKKTPWRSCT